jgi:hypothetical protein
MLIGIEEFVGNAIEWTNKKLESSSSLPNDVGANSVTGGRCCLYQESGPLMVLGKRAL